MGKNWDKLKGVETNNKQDIDRFKDDILSNGLNSYHQKQLNLIEFGIIKMRIKIMIMNLTIVFTLKKNRMICPNFSNIVVIFKNFANLRPKNSRK